VSSSPDERAFLRLPDPASRFEARARRLRALAAGHAAGDWLLLLSRIADAQHAAVGEVRAPTVRAPGDGPPLAFDRLPRDATWRRMLAVVLSGTDAPALPAETREAIRGLLAADAPRLEALADRRLAGATDPGELTTAPFVGAALQAWFGALAGALAPTPSVPVAGGCPICGAPPVAGVIDGTTRLRYLVCSLCGSEWNLPRMTCSACGDDVGVTYFHVDGDEGAQAEACGACRGYTKLFDLEKRAGAEPIADDAATLALDLLMAEEGYHRIGESPFLAVAERC
jgi:FdhE protein